MPHTFANGIMLEYDRSGPANGAPILLIHGVGAQLIRWPRALLDGLAAQGFETIRYDSRDIGLSTHMDGAPVPDLAAVTDALRRGETPELPYTLSDLAADAVGLLDALEIEGAHIVGVSLGGMIAQVLAIGHPSRVRSLTVIMSTSGNPALPGANPKALAKLAAVPPRPAEDMEAYLAHSVALNRTLGSPGYPTTETDLRAFARRAAERAYYPIGAARQLAAGRGAVDRRAGLRLLSVPTLVIHGADDPLIPAAAGEDVARNVKDAWLLKVGGMGHDLPALLCPLFALSIASNARRAV
jgi:pimeloyl-ACP methyl ester carboxylesterase